MGTQLPSLRILDLLPPSVNWPNRLRSQEADSGVQGISRERASAETIQAQQDKGTPPIPSPHPLAHTFGLTPSTVMQDPRIQSLSLPGQMHPVVPSGAVPEEYLRGLQRFSTSDDLRLTSLPLGLDPATAAHAAAAAYYHPAYLHHPLTLQRMEESLCLSALRSQFYSMPVGGTFPSLHPSALHLHLPGARYPGDLNHTVLAERLQMENELRQREREQEREREKEREREVGLERERAREEERERERERELDRQKERQRERQQQMARAAESQYLAELQARRAPPEDRARPGERLTPNRQDKPKESDHPGLPAPKPLSLQPCLHPSMGSVPHTLPSLVPSHLGKHHVPATSGIHAAPAAAMMAQRAGEDVWVARQRRQALERDGSLELGLRSPGKGVEPRRDGHRTNSVQHSSSNRDLAPHLGAPPPLISPRAPPHLPPPPTTLWNPASLIDSPTNSHRRFNPPTPPSRPPPSLTRADRTPSWGEKPEDNGRRRGDGTERCHSARGSGMPGSGFWCKAEQERPIHHLCHQPLSGKPYHRSPVTLSHPTACTESGRERQDQAANSMLVYDEVLQQRRWLLSKLDLEEKRRREAREGGYYYDQNESYDESDEEEVKAHLRRVTEQPPLKLDTSSEKVEFLRLFGLTTLAHRDELVEQKQRKRRRMLRERSLSPPDTRGKRKAPSPPTPQPSLTTPYTSQEMDSTPELEGKKDFLRMFSLSHVTPQQRRDKLRTEELLRAIQRKTVTLDTLRYNPLPPCSSPPAPSRGDSSSAHLPCQSNGQQYPDSPSPSPPYAHPPNNLNPDPFKPPVDTPVPRIPPPLAPHPEKTGFLDGQPTKKLQSLQNGTVTSAQRKELGQNGRNRPWERFTPEAFAQHFHQSVLTSTHNTLQSKGVSNCIPDAKLKADYSLPLNNSALKRTNTNHMHRHTHVNGHHLHSPSSTRATPGSQNHLSEEEEEESGQEEEEEEEEGAMGEAPRKWQGIEAVFEAYQEYMEEFCIERQVLQSQCKRLEAQNYTLSRTAEQLSLSMGELVSQKQKVREERERLQAQLEHFRRCLTLPSIYLGRGQANGHTLR
ncbi:genetic suppressor element 1-like isoform X2 [Lampris incognitus]|uniref:genetic suppressor element 1-like isoform X2 n=1 Tax=Lampris incognitus TaxID=2546036 RepID=UPI0024B53215|nr:genetic suppressor element 1-like isoform X2 [Lampris incognitus]